MRPTRSILCAANEDDDSVFCILECREAEAAAEKAKAGGGAEKAEGSREGEEHAAFTKHPPSAAEAEHR